MWDLQENQRETCSILRQMRCFLGGGNPSLQRTKAQAAVELCCLDRLGSELAAGWQGRVGFLQSLFQIWHQWQKSLSSWCASRPETTYQKEQSFQWSWCKGRRQDSDSQIQSLSSACDWAGPQSGTMAQHGTCASITQFQCAQWPITFCCATAECGLGGGDQPGISR